MVKVGARFDQYWGWVVGPLDATPIRVDPFLTEGMYDTNWELAHQSNGRAKLVLIGTWNDYLEQSQIEPSYNGPIGTGALLLEKTAFDWYRFSASQPFEEDQNPPPPNPRGHFPKQKDGL